MSKTKFTPGPWKIVEDRVPSSLEVYGGTIAICECWRRANAETEMANAHLIAAAPDLYKTLEWVYTTAVEHDDQDEFDWAIYCERLYQALAKARGESHD